MRAVSPYAALGAALTSLRIAAGFSTQGELASKLNVTQQTVSRWEKGQSRPRADQIGSVAAAVGGKADALMEAAGYPLQVAVVSLDVPFPVDALSPEAFERLAATLMEALSPEAKVHQLGGRGHTQGGLDVLMTFPTGEQWGFQCKRVTEFGPQKVREVVAKDSSVTNKKFLLLSRIASPDARAALADHADWMLWDRDDISRKIRELPVEAQKRIVRVFFPGMEIALLGSSASSPWETPDEFFLPFTRQDALFNHQWQLVGRQSEVADVLEALQDAGIGVVLLTGSGGGGKSRVLKEILSSFSVKARGTRIRVASATTDITKASLGELGDGNILLVVDDAHDRDDLQVLFAHAAAMGSHVKLLISARRYGVEHIKAQAGSYSFSGSNLKHVDLPELSLKDAEELATQVLAELGGPITAAADIAKFTLDCPLATVIGAQIVARDKIHPSFVQNEDRFRTTLLGRFEKTIAGHLSDRENPQLIQKLLGFLALVQPIAVDDERALAAFETVEGISIADAKRVMRLLVEAGVLFKRGTSYRLSPDVLGDYLVESRFEGLNGASNGLAEKYFDALPKEGIKNLLLNLGRVDWRRSGKTAPRGPLLEDVWRRLRPVQEYRDPYIAAVQAVAYYQPARALDFVEGLIREGRFLNQLAGIAKYAAYTTDYTKRACECLWELGKNDKRERNSEPSHPIRILKELAEPQPAKPTYFNDILVDFAFDLTRRSDAWRGTHTPLDILDGALITEGHTSSYSHRAISMTPYFVNPEALKPIRTKIVSCLLGLIAHSDVRRAARACDSLAKALRAPIGLLGASAGKSNLDAWYAQFEVTLSRVLAEVDLNSLDPIVQVGLSRAVNWHGSRGRPALSKLAKAIQKGLKPTIDTEIDRLLIDGYGHEHRLAHRDDHEARWSEHLASIVAKVVGVYPKPRDLIAYVSERLRRLEEATPGRTITLEVIVDRLINLAPGFAAVLVEITYENPEHGLARFTGSALGKLLQSDPITARGWIARFLSEDCRNLWAFVGMAYHWKIEGGPTNEDKNNLRKLVSEGDERTVSAVIHAARFLTEDSPDLVRALIGEAHILTQRIADEISTLLKFNPRNGLTVETMPEAEVLSLLRRIEPLPELDGHWLELLLADISEAYSWQCAQFFMRRVEAASAERDEDEPRIRPCNYGPWSHERLRFKNAPDAPEILRHVYGWMRDNRDRRGLFSYHARNLFEAMFGPFDSALVSILTQILASATDADIATIAAIVREAEPAFVFDQAPFAIALIEQAQQFGAKLRDGVISELYCSAVSGMKHGSPGEPFPEDIAMKERSVAMLEILSRFSPAYQLYDQLRQHAEYEIKRAIRDHEDVDE
jgi:transcriptional regulator with XRE-family HTH domain